jgi:putative DNA methylase
VSEEFHHFNEERYRLDAFCVMPNHVHAVLMPLPLTVEGKEAYLNSQLVSDRENRLGYLKQTDNGQKEFIEIAFHSLASIMHSLKRYTARESNRLLKRQGAFWQAESYDRYIRSNEEWERTIRYVLANPVKAGLVNDWREWPWSWSRTAQA